MRHPFHIPRPLHRLIANPVATVVLLFLLAVELDRIRGYDGLAQRSSLALFLRWEDPLPEGILATQRTLYIVRDDGRWQFLEPDRESWDAASRTLAERPQDVISATYTHSAFDRGLIHPTRRIQSHIIELKVEFGGEFTPEEHAAAGAATAAWLGLPEDITNRLRRTSATGEAGVRTSTTLARGHLLNAYLAALLAGFIYSLFWIPAAAQRIRQWRRQRALARGECPVCGYIMRSAESSTCPECGTHLPELSQKP